MGPFDRIPTPRLAFTLASAPTPPVSLAAGDGQRPFQTRCDAGADRLGAGPAD